MHACDHAAAGRPASQVARGVRRRLPTIASLAGFGTVFAGMVLSAAPRAMAAQDSPPAGWSWALDREAKWASGSRMAKTDSTFDFVHMAPGWHITMGPGGALFDPRERVSGRFIVEAELILFPDATNGEYGVFVGDRMADGASAEWTAFVVRAEPDSVRFHVNGERIAAWPRSAMPLDGVTGFRIGEGVNLHITNLDVTRRLAPFPDHP